MIRRRTATVSSTVSGRTDAGTPTHDDPDAHSDRDELGSLANFPMHRPDSPITASADELSPAPSPPPPIPHIAFQFPTLSGQPRGGGAVGSGRASSSQLLDPGVASNLELNERTVNSVNSATSSHFALFEEDGSNRRKVTAMLQEHDPPSPPAHFSSVLVGTPASHARAKTHSPPEWHTMQGVFLPCLQNMLNIIFFIRLPWIIGVSGVGLTLAYLGVAMACTLTTAMSIGAIISNGVNAGGGAYYLVSRTLGPELGGSVGILFYISTSIAVAVSIIGATEVLLTYAFPLSWILATGPQNEIRLVGFITLCITTALTFLKLRPFSRLTTMAIVISGIGLLSIYVGLLASNRLVATAPAIFAGFPGQLSVNFGPHFEDAAASMPVSSSVAPPTWASQFGLFFPCVTGMMSGANKSGGVHNPSRAIPRGTLAAILASAAIYLSAILLVGTVMYGEALRTMAPSRPGRDVPPPLLAFAQVSWPAEWLGYMATVAAALGAAMQATTAANRVMRAMVRDGILGLNHVLTTQLRAAVLTFVISAAVVLVGNLDAVAPITTMCYLLAYAALNLGTALGGFTHAPTWRPTWKYFHWAVSLSGAMLCITLMFVLSWWIALGALTAALILYYAVQLHGASGQWGYDGWWSFAMQVARQNLWRLESMSITAGTWRPQIIALIPPDETAARPEGENNDLSHGLSVSASVSAAPSPAMLDPFGASVVASHARNTTAITTTSDLARTMSRNRRLVSADGSRSLSARHLIALLGQLKKGGGLAIVAHAIVSPDVLLAANSHAVERATTQLRAMLSRQSVEAFTEVFVCRRLVEGVASAIQSVGIGALRPNTVMLGFPAPVADADLANDLNGVRRIDSFVSIVRHVVALDKAVLVVKSDASWPMLAPDAQSAPIDVFWIMHDGGMLCLLPWLLKRHSVWRACPLRIFVVAQLTDNSIQIRNHLVATLHEMRITAEAHVLELGDHDVSEFVYERTLQMEARQRLLLSLEEGTQAEGTKPAPGKVFLNRSLSFSAAGPRRPGVSHSSGALPPPVAEKHHIELMDTSIQLNSLMQQHSSQSSLIFCNLPAPTVKQSSVEYFEYLEALTAGLDRIVLLKGSGLEVV